VPITVIKHDDKRESFDPSKLLRGMVRACEKTGISLQRLQTIVDDIEAQLQQSPKREVTSHEIGQLVLSYLQKENEVAYIRFASVYGRFQGIADFVKTLEKLQPSSELLTELKSEPWQSDHREEANSVSVPSG
jgi:transcriptional repressor NrdR